MIPHHSMAITRSERAGIQDVRVCELAVAISEAQRREILEMDSLIEDIRQNGIATTRTRPSRVPSPTSAGPWRGTARQADTVTGAQGGARYGVGFTVGVDCAPGDGCVLGAGRAPGEGASQSSHAHSSTS